MNLKKIAIVSVALNVAFLIIGGYFFYSNMNLYSDPNKKVSVTNDNNERKVETKSNNSSTESIPAENNKDKKYGISPQYKVRSTLINSDNKLESGVLFLGDSLTDYNEWDEAFPGIKTYNRGISGDTTLGVIHRLNQVISLKPSKIFLMIGVNDLAAKTPKENVLKNYKYILEQLTVKLPNTKIFIESMLPVKPVSKSTNLNNSDINWLNKELENLAKENNHTFIDLHSLFTDEEGELKKEWTVDGVHVNGEGYKIWENKIKNYVYQ
ncbi:platelet activating factor [Bacillus mycoides]|nr:platelet activating factor [Bacillus mycoides]